MTQERAIELAIQIFVGVFLTSIIGMIGYVVSSAYESLATAIQDLTQVLSSISKQQARTEARVDEHERRLNEHAMGVSRLTARCFTMHADKEEN